MRVLGFATDSAKYGLNAVDNLQTEWGALLLKIRCPSHLLHDMVEFICNLTFDDLRGVCLCFRLSVTNTNYNFKY